jgi:hypothetical protein
MRKVVFFLAAAVVTSTAVSSSVKARDLFETIKHDATQVLREEVESSAAKAGAAVGGYYGGPVGAAGGYVAGREGGKQINKCFEGQCPIGRAAQPDGRATQPRSAPPNSSGLVQKKLCMWGSVSSPVSSDSQNGQPCSGKTSDGITFNGTVAVVQVAQ